MSAPRAETAGLGAPWRGGSRSTGRGSSADDDVGEDAGSVIVVPPRQCRVKIDGSTVPCPTGQPAIRHVAAVQRAVAVLDALAGEPELGTNEIARRTGINASTVSRLLSTLAEAGLVDHDADAGAIGWGSGSCTSATPSSPASTSRDRARSSSPFPGDGRDRDVVGARRAPGDYRRLRSEPGVRAERRSAPAGRASRTRPSARSISRSVASFQTARLKSSPNTITDRARLTAEIVQATERGWAQVTGEREEDLNASCCTRSGQPRRADHDPRRPGAGRPVRRHRDGDGDRPAARTGGAHLRGGGLRARSHHPLEPDRRA